MAKESIPFRNGVLGNKPKNSYQRFASTNACSDLFTFYLHFTILKTRYQKNRQKVIHDF